MMKNRVSRAVRSQLTRFILHSQPRHFGVVFIIGEADAAAG